MRLNLPKVFRLICLSISLTGKADEPIVRMLVPAFTVQELPLNISNQNNLRFAADGTLTSPISDNDPDRLAETIGLASQSKRSKYLHTPLDLKFVPTHNAVTKNFPKQIHFLDEPYWPLIGDTNKVVVLATVKMEGADWPEVWTFEKGKGRVFGCVIGHYTWTQEDPLYRILILRGLGWAAREDNF